MKHILLSGLAFGFAFALSSQTVLFEENFDSYEDGDTIANVSQSFVLWSDPDVNPTIPQGTPPNLEEHAFVTNEASISGANSLKIEATNPNGSGPMDVLLYCNLPGTNEFTFKTLVPLGYSGYYNFQGLLTVGQGEGVGVWAFNCFLNSDSTVTFSLDPGTPPVTEFTTTYNYGQWVEFSHQIDTDAGTMNILIDGDCVGEFPYSSDLVGHINFYPTSGDGAPALYFVDDIKVSALEDLPSCGTDGTDDVAEMHMEMVFGPNPAKDNLRIQANFDQAVVRILALNGQVVFEDVRSDLRNGTQIDLNLDNGIYLLEVSHGLERSTQRLVVQK